MADNSSTQSGFMPNAPEHLPGWQPSPRVPRDMQLVVIKTNSAPSRSERSRSPTKAPDLLEVAAAPEPVKTRWQDH
eukprot:5228220-Karenia_brevis.AAC.1